MGLEAVARLCYEEAMQRALATLPLAKMYDVGEGAATAVAVERSATGLKERYEGVVRAIGEAQFTGKGDKEKVCGAAAGGVSAGASSEGRVGLAVLGRCRVVPDIGGCAPHEGGGVRVWECRLAG